MKYIIQLRRDTAAHWANNNPILGEGEPGYEKDTGRLKVGNGTTHWNDLQYFVLQEPEDANMTLIDHVNSEDPHPVYDDGRSFELLYQNAKV